MPTELALVVLTLVTAVGYARVFAGWDWLLDLATLALASHLLALACRRAGWSTLTSTVAGLAGLAVALSLVFYQDVSAYGLPTRRTWERAGTDLSDAWTAFATAVPPIEPGRGYLVAAGAALWVAAWFADGFAFRARAGLEALLPTAVLFVFASALAADRLRIASTVAWLVAALLVSVLHRVLRQETAPGWLASGRGSAGATPNAVRIGAGLLAVAVVAGALIGPALPGAGEEALVDATNEDDSRVTLSPLVDIRGRLAQRSDVEAFTVSSAQGTYWRLTALTDFDGSTWTSRSEVDDADGRLERGFDDSVAGQEVTQGYTVTGLGGIWLPAAFSPVGVDIDDGPGVPPDAGITFDEDTSSLVSEGDDPAGLTYTVRSVLPRFDTATLQAAEGEPSGGDVERNLALPAEFPADLVAQARAITAEGGTRYDRALALQDYFRAFTYDLSFEAGHSDDAIRRFLAERRGYCEQFAGTYAAFARAVGLPARVAVGFTQGRLDEGGDGRYHVLGRHAHAWPEVYFDGIGWVPFEPTPGRGNPLTTSYTGVAPAQDDGTGDSTAVPTSAVPAPTTAATGPNDPSALPELELPSETTTAPFEVGGRDGSGLGWFGWVLVVVVVGLIGLVAWVGALVLLRRSARDRRRRRATSPADSVLVSWAEAREALQRTGQAPAPSETPLEFAGRSGRSLGVEATAVQQLADDTTAAAYAPGGVEPVAAERSAATVATLERRVHAATSLTDRLRWAADPRTVTLPRRRRPR